MTHAERLTDRILLLDGLPNYQRLFSLRVGQTVREQFESDLAIEVSVVERLRPGIVMCRERQDVSSANLLESIMLDEELHIDYLETQLALMDQLGEANYLSQCLSRPPTSQWRRWEGRLAIPEDAARTVRRDSRIPQSRGLTSAAGGHREASTKALTYLSRSA